MWTFRGSARAKRGRSKICQTRENEGNYIISPKNLTEMVQLFKSDNVFAPSAPPYATLVGVKGMKEPILTKLLICHPLERALHR